MPDVEGMFRIQAEVYGRSVMNVTFILPVRGQGLPASIPYRKITEMQAIIQRGQGDPVEPVHLDIAICSSENGVASVLAGVNWILSGTVLLREKFERSPGIAAAPYSCQCNGHEWTSDGFAVCAHPSSVHNGPDFAPHVYVEIRHDPLNPEAQPTREPKAGLYVEITIKSDSGFDDDLDHVIDQEMVSAPMDRSASMNRTSSRPCSTRGRRVGNQCPY